MAARSASLALLFLMLMITAGCRDDVENIVSSTEPDGGIIIDPGLGDRGVRDAGGAADEGVLSTDASDAVAITRDAEGMLIRQDSGNPPVDDMGIDGAVDAGNALDVGMMIFPDHPLPPSQCGRFGPREALHANPARVESYRHSGPGEWFNEPALYGCTPASLRWEEGVDDARVWQRFDFEYEGLRAPTSRWQFGEAMGSAELIRTLAVDQHGLVTQVAYRCEDGVSEAVVELEYDRRGRLVEYTRNGEMDCPALNAPLGVTIEYAYEGEMQLPTQFIVRVEVAQVEIAHQLEYIWENERITRIDMQVEGGDDKYRVFTYDADGRIEREEIWRLQRDKADREISYQYDDQGRLTTKRDSSTGQYRFEYDALGELSGVSWPNGEVLIGRGHPEWIIADVFDGP